MSIVTKIGDNGNTNLLGCNLVSKSDIRIDILGILDELNSTIGLSLCYMTDKGTINCLKNAQNNLFTLGSDLIGTGLHIDDSHVINIENKIEELEKEITLPESFISPGGNVASSYLHLCRTITRKSERSLVNIRDEVPFSPKILQYINRLSDLFFVLAINADNNEVVDK